MRAFNAHYAHMEPRRLRHSVRHSDELRVSPSREEVEEMKRILVLMVAGALILALSSTSARADGTGFPLIVFTENSSTDLAVTLFQSAGSAGVPFGTVTGGGTPGGDTWEWAPPLAYLVLEPNLDAEWYGLSEQSKINSVSQHTGLFGVISDTDAFETPVSDLTRALGQITLSEIGTGAITYYDVMFVDNATSREVPGSLIVLLLGSGLVVLAAYLKFKKK